MTTVKINNQTVESFLNEQATKYNTSTKDYLINLVMAEIEYIKVKKDIDILQSEINQVNSGNLKLEKADILVNEL
jgi:hypothetical protein